MLDFTEAYNKNPEKNDWNFKILEEPVIGSISGKPIDGYKRLYREDTGCHLGFHRNSYTVIHNDTVVESIIDAVKSSNLSSDYRVKIDSHQNGKKLKGEIIFDDIILQPQKDDTIKFRISFFNSYDGSWAFQQQVDGIRLVCTNGMTMADTIAKTWAKHTQHVNIEGSAAKIVSGYESFKNQKPVYDLYRRTKICMHDAEIFYTKYLVQDYKTKTTLNNSHNKKQLENLLKQTEIEFNQLGRNQWAAFNAMTHWSSHTDMLKNPVVAERNRNQKVAAAIQTVHWKNLGDGPSYAQEPSPYKAITAKPYTTRWNKPS